MTGTASVVLACTATADDNGTRALHDVATVAGDIEYRVIGGHMVRLLRHIYNVPGPPHAISRTSRRCCKSSHHSPSTAHHPGG